MLLLLVAFLAAWATPSSFVLSAPAAELGRSTDWIYNQHIITTPAAGEPTEYADWTYYDIYHYAVKRGGIGDPVADLIATHVGATKKGWDEVYQYDIKLSNGGILTVPNSASSGLLQSIPFPDGHVQAFPWVGDCNGDVSFTWTPVTTDGCYTYVDNGVRIRMYSARVSGLWSRGDGPEFFMFLDSESCGIFHQFDNRWTTAPTQCFGNANSGRGFMAWEIIWPHR